MRIKWRKAKAKPKKEYYIANEKIQASQVLLINQNKEKVGVTDTSKALEMAKEQDLDLVLMNPKGDPPVAKILDLGQLKYEKAKKEHKQKVQQKKVEIKNVRLSVRIGENDLNLRLNQAIKFLKKDNKLKIELNLKGREKQHPEKAKEMINNFVDKLKNEEELNIEVEQPLTKQGGKFSIILINKK